MTDRVEMAQDPAERFDVVSADGTPTGVTKARAEVHRDGDWHRSLHCWVAGLDVDGDAFILFQQRGSGKDSWPGYLDATVGGHFAAGENAAAALREVREEIGITPAPERTRLLGVRVSVNESTPGVIDRELQTVALLRDDRPLVSYRPNPAELSALIRFPLVATLAFFAGELPVITGEMLSAKATETERATFSPGDFIPSVDRYFFRVAIAIAAALRGESYVAV